jgi:hypothetical protein
MKTEQRLAELGIELTKPTSPMANYVNAVRTGTFSISPAKDPACRAIRCRSARSVATSPGSRATSMRARPASA